MQTTVLKFVCGLAIAVCGCAADPGNPDAHAGTAGKPYSLPRTSVGHIHSTINDIDYVLYISLPKTYGQGEKSYPLVITLDADYSFALSHNIVEHFVDRGNLPELMIIGIAYEGASQDIPVYRRNRTRDYTPTYTLTGGYGPEFQKLSGGGDQFRDFIAEELIPFLESNYRVKPKDRTFVGHSFGGLFGTYVLLSRPQTFQRYILVSPSLWYDDKYIFGLEQRSPPLSDSLAARVFFAVGRLENQPGRRYAMVDDMQEMIERLRSHAYPGLDIQSYVFEQETHNSVFPAALTRGLRVVFARDPY